MFMEAVASNTPPPGFQLGVRPLTSENVEPGDLQADTMKLDWEQETTPGNEKRVSPLFFA
jgi:hypothetical protein